jgi:hypothetical protein
MRFIAILTLSISSLFLIQEVSAQTKPAQFQIGYQFKGIEEGYDHLTKTVITVDGREVYTTPEHLQSKKMKAKVKIPAGSHIVSVDTWAKYEGTWELHTVANNYSLDCNYVTNRDFESGKKYKVGLVYDLDNGVTVKE